MKKLIWTLPLLALVTACGKAEKHDEAATEMAPMQAVTQTEAKSDADEVAAAGSAQLQVPKLDVLPQPIAAPAGGQAATGGPALKQAPGVDGSIAPAVAFDYRYTFSLAGDIIPDIQEEHAAMCAKLGADKCRVTSVLFDKQRDGSIKANLSLKLDRAYALRFGRDATDLVKKAEGALETSLVVGSDAGGAIENNAETADEARESITKAETRLRQSGLGEDERQMLGARIEEMRVTIERLGKDSKQKAKSLVLTPMVFTYEVSDTVLGMRKSSPVGTGLSLGGTSFSTLFGFLAIALGVLAPWALVGGLIWWGARKLLARRMTVAALTTE